MLVDDLAKVEREKQAREVYRDAIRGCLIGGAAGDALGYAVEFIREPDIFARYGPDGITAYELDRETGKALISDDTQMTLFTATGLLVGDTRRRLRGIGAMPRCYVEMAYQDWLHTQNNARGEVAARKNANSWLSQVPELYAWRAPGVTCLSALEQKGTTVEDYIEAPCNHSKGCGGVMRVAPVALQKWHDIEAMDWEAAQIAAITHGHSLGYMPAAVLCHVISRIVFDGERDLHKLIPEARDTAKRLFAGDKHLQELTDLIDRAVALAGNGLDDLENIRALGEGWVAEETLAVALYCSLRYADDFSAGIIAAVNHSGDSDSTGAVTGNILGALAGYDRLEEKWKTDLECADVILEIADDLCYGCRMSEYGAYRDEDWVQKYIFMNRVK